MASVSNTKMKIFLKRESRLNMSDNEICKTCKWWKADYGIFTATGWTGDGTNGNCYKEVKIVYKKHDDFCSHHEEK